MPGALHKAPELEIYSQVVKVKHVSKLHNMCLCPCLCIRKLLQR